MVGCEAARVIVPNSSVQESHPQSRRCCGYSIFRRLTVEYWDGTSAMRLSGMREEKMMEQADLRTRVGM